jgi:hypothetical protein
VAFENFTNLFLVAKFLMMLYLVDDIGRDRFHVIVNANSRHSAALTLYQLPDHRPEHRSPLSGRVAFNAYPGLKHLG